MAPLDAIGSFDTADLTVMLNELVVKDSAFSAGSAPVNNRDKDDITNLTVTV